MSTSGFRRAPPEVELHVHLVWSASVPTVLGLAARHGSSLVPSDRDELAAFYSFRDFAHFIDVYTAVNDLVTGPADIVARLTGLTGDLAAGGVRYAEATVTPVSHLDAGIPPASWASTPHGRRSRGCCSAATTARSGSGSAGPRSVWAGRSSGPRARWPGSRSCAACRIRETTGPATVWSALHELGTERIGHGIHEGFGLTPAELVGIATSGWTRPTATRT